MSAAPVRSIASSRRFKVVRPASLLPVVEAVVRRAERQGSIVPKQVREELARLGRNQALWKEVIHSAGERLEYRRGRYHYVPPHSPSRQHEENRNQDIHLAIHYLVDEYRREDERLERREADRYRFIQTVTIRTEDGRESQVVTKDISAAGLRLIAPTDFLGQKLVVTIPTVSGKSRRFALRVLWTCRVGDGLFENGGRFLEVIRT